MPAIGIEPIRCCHHRILSPARLPVPPRRLELIENCAIRSSPSALYEAYHGTRKIRLGVSSRQFCFPRSGKIFLTKLCDWIFSIYLRKQHVVFLNGWRRIRTFEDVVNRFTVCPLWPLGNPSKIPLTI